MPASEKEKEGRIKEGKGGIKPKRKVGAGQGGDGRRKEEERSGGMDTEEGRGGGFFSCFLREAVEGNWFLM